jgi:hypothetical protein
MAERLMLMLHQRQLKRKKTFSLEIREPQLACSNLELPVNLQGTSLSFPPYLYASLKYCKYRLMLSSRDLADSLLQYSIRMKENGYRRCDVRIEEVINDGGL